MEHYLPEHNPRRLTPEEWQRVLMAMADEADRLHADPDATSQQLADLAVKALGWLWVALSPRVIAASCRASIAAGCPVLVVMPMGLQIVEAEDTIADALARGDRWQLGPIDLVEAPTIQRRRPAPPKPPAPPPPPPEPLPEPAPAPAPAPGCRSIEEAGDGWLTTAETAELLGVATSTIRQVAARLLSPEQWARGAGRRPTRFSVEAVERLQHHFERRQDGQVAAPGADLRVQAELDRLLAEVRREA